MRRLSPSDGRRIRLKRNDAGSTQLPPRQLPVPHPMRLVRIDTLSLPQILDIRTVVPLGLHRRACCFAADALDHSVVQREERRHRVWFVSVTGASRDKQGCHELASKRRYRSSGERQETKRCKASMSPTSVRARRRRSRRTDFSSSGIPQPADPPPQWSHRSALQHSRQR